MDQLQYVLYLALLFAFGLVFGSFGNVVIWRLPRGESLSQPPSHCPKCGHDVRPRDNVPVVSWLLLRGRCRDCGAPISVRYPIVETISGMLWLTAGILYGFSWQTAAAVCLFYLLLLLTAIDLDTMRLPNALVGIIAAVGLGGAIVSQFTGIRFVPLVGLGASGWFAQPLAVSALGALLGAGVPAAIGMTYALVRHRQGVGLGDVKLLGATGFFLGPYVMLAFLFATVLGSVFGIALVRRSGRAAAVAAPVAESIESIETTADVAIPGAEAAGEGPLLAAVPYVGSQAAVAGTGEPAIGDGDASALDADDADGGMDDAPTPAMQVPFPFGLFLAVGILLTVVIGPAAWQWYRTILGLG